MPAATPGRDAGSAVTTEQGRSIVERTGRNITPRTMQNTLIHVRWDRGRTRRVTRQLRHQGGGTWCCGEAVHIDRGDSGAVGGGVYRVRPFRTHVNVLSAGKASERVGRDTRMRGSSAGGPAGSGRVHATMARAFESVDSLARILMYGSVTLDACGQRRGLPPHILAVDAVVQQLERRRQEQEEAPRVRGAAGCGRRRALRWVRREEVTEARVRPVTKMQPAKSGVSQTSDFR